MMWDNIATCNHCPAWLFQNATSQPPPPPPRAVGDQRRTPGLSKEPRTRAPCTTGEYRWSQNKNNKHGTAKIETPSERLVCVGRGAKPAANSHCSPPPVLDTPSSEPGWRAANDQQPRVLQLAISTHFSNELKFGNNSSAAVVVSVQVINNY